MKPGPEVDALRWLKQARQDLSDAAYMKDGGRHNVACFLAQQATEKALKAYLYARGVEDPWGHSAADLCDAAAEFDATFADIKSQAAALDKYYIPTRYPNGLPGGLPSEAFGEADSERALADAEAVIAGSTERIESPGE